MCSLHSAQRGLAADPAQRAGGLSHKLLIFCGSFVPFPKQRQSSERGNLKQIPSFLLYPGLVLLHLAKRVNSWREQNKKAKFSYDFLFYNQTNVMPPSNAAHHFVRVFGQHSLLSPCLPKSLLNNQHRQEPWSDTAQEPLSSSSTSTARSGTP